MLFSSITFLYYFLPAVLILYFITPGNKTALSLRNLVLLFASVLFYGWGEPVYVLVMVGQSFSGWAFGLLIDRRRGSPVSQAALVCAVAVGIGGLMFFKYSNFFIENINAALRSSIALFPFTLPIGISFYTFQILSYVIDLYRGKATVQRNFFTFSTYVMLFPQLIAGPIVRYVDVAAELETRRNTLALFASGVRRFTLGLGKKVLIANVLGELADICKNSGEHSVLILWLYILAYTFHIYFDFSGYSDMAIGLGRMFGFHFRENFNYPYTATSITDFWRRWHMSLSSWFRDYVYIPLGGNRVGPARHILNILVVWLLTGFWHGAGWNFIVWGLYFAALLLLEKFVLGRLLERLPSLLVHAYVMLCVIFSWVFFDAPDLSTAAARFSGLLALDGRPLGGAESLYYLRSYAVPLLVAAIGCTQLPARLMARVNSKPASERLLCFLEPLAIGLLLLVITAYLVDGSFNPFIYFRF
jgi:alginate O-acetyltransferase complex protein AlgI